MLRTAHLIPVLMVALALAGCGPSPQKEAEDARARAGSWAAAVKVAVEQWASDIVPRHFVVSMLDAADRDLASEAAHVNSRAGADAAEPLVRVHDALPVLADLVKRSDETAALALASRLVASVPPVPVPPEARPQLASRQNGPRAGGGD